MKVKATQPGFYETLRKEGDAFEISSEKEFSKVWMERVVKPRPKKEAE